MSEKTCGTRNYVVEGTNVLFTELNRMIDIGELAAEEIRFATVRLITANNVVQIKLELLGKCNTVINFTSPYGNIQPVFSILQVLGFLPKENIIVGLKPGNSCTFFKKMN